jgi:hypothetical protein
MENFDFNFVKLIGTCATVASIISSLLWFIISLRFSSNDKQIELMDEKARRYAMELIVAERGNVIKELESKSQKGVELVFALSDKLNETDMKHSIQYTSLANKTEDTTRRLENLEIHMQKLDEKLSVVSTKIDVLIGRGA